MVNRLQGAPRARTLAWVVGVTSVALIVGALIIMYPDRASPCPRTSRRENSATPGHAGQQFVPIIGVVLATRRPEQPHRVDVPDGGVLPWPGQLHQQYAIRGLIVDPAPCRWFSASLGWRLVVGDPAGVLPFLFLLFPDGRLPSPRRRWVAWSRLPLVAVLVLRGRCSWRRSSWRCPRRSERGLGSRRRRDRHVRYQLPPGRWCAGLCRSWDS